MSSSSISFDSMSLFRLYRSALLRVALLTILTARFTGPTLGGPFGNISIDGAFSDWDSVPAYFDADGGLGVMHTGTLIPDIHDTDHSALGDIPSYVDHPDVDILEYKFTHDASNLYAYFKADGVIGNTQTAAQGKAGRYYVIVTIDVDNDNSTGYYLHEGGYFPTSGTDRYDMNMEAEFYDGQLNTAHYLSHDANGATELEQDFMNLTSGVWPAGAPGPYTPGFVDPADGTYDDYTQWVYHNNDTLTLVADKGPVVPGIMSVALSADGHEIEICAPFKGFLSTSWGSPNMALGKTIDVSFSLEASGELAPGGDWASDTADPIVGYYLGSYSSDFDLDGDVDGNDLSDVTEGWESRFGVDLDGSDFLDWQRQFGIGVLPLSAGSAIPEPTAVILGIGLPLAALVGRRRS